MWAVYTFELWSTVMNAKRKAKSIAAEQTSAKARTKAEVSSIGFTIFET